MIRLNWANVLDFLTDSLRYIVLMLILLRLVGVAASIGM